MGIYTQHRFVPELKGDGKDFSFRLRGKLSDKKERENNIEVECSININ